MLPFSLTGEISSQSSIQETVGRKKVNTSEKKKIDHHFIKFYWTSVISHETTWFYF